MTPQPGQQTITINILPNISDNEICSVNKT